MKKIGKLSINPEKVIKNEELVNLKGGVRDACTCICFDANTGMQVGGYLLSPDGQCGTECIELHGPGHSGVCTGDQ